MAWVPDTDSDLGSMADGGNPFAAQSPVEVRLQAAGLPL